MVFSPSPFVGLWLGVLRGIRIVATPEEGVLRGAGTATSTAGIIGSSATITSVLIVIVDLLRAGLDISQIVF